MNANAGGLRSKVGNRAVLVSGPPGSGPHIIGLKKQRSRVVESHETQRGVTLKVPVVGLENAPQTRKVRGRVANGFGDEGTVATTERTRVITGQDGIRTPWPTTELW